MESRIQWMLTSALCMLTWATGSMTVLQNVTQPTVSVPFTRNLTGEYFNNEDNYKVQVEICFFLFNQSMSGVDPERWCKWEDVVSHYIYLRECLECYADEENLAFPNDLAHAIILKAHVYYFTNCNLLSEEFMDPPDNVLLALIFAPICIIPFLVTLVVFKSNTIEQQT